MPKVYLPQFFKTIDISEKDSLMDELLRHEIPVASSCGGDGICGKCVVFIEGPPLPEKSELERRTLDKQSASKEERLSCQIKLLKSSKVQTNYW